MNEAEVLEKLKEITTDILKIDVALVKEDSRFSEDLGADSLQSLELVAAFDEGFDIEMDEDGALEIKNVNDAVTFIKGYVDKK